MTDILVVNIIRILALGALREIWKINLTRLIGDKSLKEVSADSGVPYRSLQNMLDGGVAYGENLEKLATYFQVPETRFFADPATPTPRDSFIARIVSGLSSLNDEKLRSLSNLLDDWSADEISKPIDDDEQLRGKSS